MSRGSIAALVIVAATTLLVIVRHRTSSHLAPFPSVRIGDRARAEGCLLCHSNTRGLGEAHASIGCSPCHGGDVTARDQASAHRGMDVLAGDLSTAMSTCGTASCHPVETARVLGSMMAGAPGILSVDRFAFREREDPTPRSSDDLRALDPRSTPHANAEDHARRLCASCHLARRKDARGDLGFASRGGGCTACHLAPPDARNTVNTSSDAMLHPDVSAAVSSSRCRGCHARSGRISLSYEGLVELEPDDPRVTERLPDGRPAGRLSPDVHSRGGLTCVDCHTERDLMGDGRTHGFATEAVGIACDDCHAPSAHAVDPDAESVAVRLRAAWVRRGRAATPDGSRNLVTSSGVPLWRTDRTTATMWRADDGVARAIPPRSNQAHHAMRGHERLECQSCHSVWTPRCASCHTTFDPSGHDVDHLTGTPRDGAWRETAGANGYGPPVLMVNGANRLAPFTEGMTFTLDGVAQTIERRLWAPLDPHTTGPSRACSSCHPAGPLDAIYPTGEVTRPRARPLDERERARVSTVGRCVACHSRYDDAVYRDFAQSLIEAERRARTRGDPHATAPRRDAIVRDSRTSSP